MHGVHQTNHHDRHDHDHESSLSSWKRHICEYIQHGGRQMNVWCSIMQESFPTFPNFNHHHHWHRGSSDGKRFHGKLFTSRLEPAALSSEGVWSKFSPKVSGNRRNDKSVKTLETREITNIFVMMFNFFITFIVMMFNYAGELGNFFLRWEGNTVKWSPAQGGVNHDIQPRDKIHVKSPS